MDDFDKATLFNSEYEAINYAKSEIDYLQTEDNISNYCNWYVARVALNLKVGDKYDFFK